LLITGARQGLAGSINSGDPAGGGHDPLPVVDAARVRLINELCTAGELGKCLAVHAGGLHLTEVGGDDAERSHKLRHILVGGKPQRRGGSIQHIIFGCAQVIRQRAPGIAAEICAVHDLIISRGIPCAGVDGLKPNRLDGQGVTPIKRFKRRGGIVGNTGEVVADELPRHDLHITGFLDGNVGRQTLVGHSRLDDLTGILNFYLNGCLIQPVKLRRLGFHDLVPRQRQGFAHRQAVFVRLDCIHQTVGAGVVDLKDGVGNGRPGRPAIHGVVVRTDLRHLDLTGNRGVLPLDFRGFARFHIHGLFLRVGNISLIFQFPQIVAAIFQSLKPDITAIIAGFLRNGIVAGIVQNERNAGDALAGDSVDLVDQNAGDSLVGDLQRGGLAIPDLDPVGRVIQTVALGSFQLRHGVPAVFCFGEMDHTVFIGGVGTNDLAIHFPNLELDAGDAFSGFFALLNDGKPARTDIIKAKGLHLARLDENGFRGTIQYKAIHGLDLPRRNGGAGNQVMDNDAAILIGDELSVASAHNSAAAVGHKEGHALQRRRGALDILFNHKGGAGRVGEVQGLGVIGVDHHGLGAAGLDDGVTRNGGRFRHHQRPYHTMYGDF
ncbi:Inner membrane protein ypdA, partial [Dysosmobacter welbionis]